MTNRVPMTRRQWLVATGASAAGCLLGSSCAKDAAPYGRFAMGVQSYSLRRTDAVAALADQARSLGLPFVELWTGHRASATSDDELRDTFAAQGLQVNAYGTQRFTGDAANDRSYFEIAQRLGAQQITANPDPGVLPSLVPLVLEFDISLAIHNHGPEDANWRTPQQVLTAVEGLDARIGACADVGHYIRAGIDPLTALEQLGDRVLGVHLKDYDGDDRPVGLGDGSLELAPVLAHLHERRFAGPLALEYEGDPDDPVPALLDALTRVRDVIAAF